MQLKLCQGCELQHSKSFEREKLNPFHLPRLSIPEEGDNGKSEGEVAKCSESPGGLNVQQKTQVHFFWKKDFDRLIFNPSKVTILGNYFPF